MQLNTRSMYVEKQVNIFAMESMQTDLILMYQKVYRKYFISQCHIDIIY